MPEKIDSVLVREIDESCFEGLDIESIVLPESLTTIDNNAFKNCSSLQKATMNGVQKIGENAFNNCVSLKSAECSDQLLSIGNKAFYQCTNLDEFYFGDSLTSVGTDAFYCVDMTALLSDNACLEKTNFARESEYFTDNLQIVFIFHLLFSSYLFLQQLLL